MSNQSGASAPLMLNMRGSDTESDGTESIPLDTRSSLARNGRLSEDERRRDGLYDGSNTSNRKGRRCLRGRVVSLTLTISLTLNLVLGIALLTNKGQGQSGAFPDLCALRQNITETGQQHKSSQTAIDQGSPAQPTLVPTATTTTTSTIHTFTRTPPRRINVTCASTSSVSTCGVDADLTQSPKDTGYVNVFRDLTRSEISAVVDYLLRQSALGLRLGNGGYYTSDIFGVELYVPDKGATLGFLDGSSARPPREALATVIVNSQGRLHGGRVVRQYVVGPLPRPTSHRINPRMTKAVPESRLTGAGFVEAYGYILQVLRTTTGLDHLLRESFGVTPADCPSDPTTFPQRPCVTVMGQKISFGLVNTTSFIFTTYYNAEFNIVHPLPFQVIVSETFTHTYAVRLVYYAGSVYSSLPELVRRYNRGDINKVRMRYPQNAPGDSSIRGSMNLRGAPSPPTPHPPPRQYEPKGPRFSIEEQHVKYLEWTFNVRTSVESGPQLWDVRWSGERLAYELSLQEIVVLYAGANPASMLAHLSDSAFGLGDNAKPLVPGVDCPEHAQFLSLWLLDSSRDSRSHAKEATHSVCVFEQNSGVPLRRHSSQETWGRTYGGLVDYHLVVRSIIVEYNYDYVLDFVFHANGAMELRAYATGYIMSQWFRAAESPFAFQVLENVAGSVHHHLFHFKVDLDVGGVSNRYETLDFEVDDRDWPWLDTLKSSATSSSSSSSRTFQQISFKRSLKKTEKEAEYHYNFEKPKYHIFYNNANKNRFGDVRAYRLETRGFSKQLLPSEHPALRSRKWANYQMAVTERKEREMKSSSVFSMYDGDEPVVNFEDFLADDDSIVDKDLVTWVTVGMHHIPHTEDLPNTPTVGTEASLLLLPYNYFPECPSVRSRDAIRAEKIPRNGGDAVTHFWTYGTERDFSCRPPVYGWLQASNGRLFP